MSIRVLQWSSGRVGRACADALLARPEFELAGLGVYDPAKVGRDIGDILGRAPIGLAAVGVRELVEMEADCVVHTPKGEFSPDATVDDICALLASGKNVCSTALMSLVHPRTMTPEHRAKIEAACEAGGSTFHATGINPGFFADVMTMTLSGLCRDVARVHAIEIYDYSKHTSHTTVVELLKFGCPPEASARPRAYRVGPADPALHVLADAMGAVIDEVEHVREDVDAEAAFNIRTTRIEAGTHAAHRVIVRGLEKGRERIRFEYIGRAAPHVAPAWPAPAREGVHRWENRIYGEPNIVSSIELGVDDEAGTSGAVATGMRAVNAVGPVCADAPGIATILDLGLLRAPFAR